MPPLFGSPGRDLWSFGVAGLGLAVGIVAGMFGIGGGIFLTPLLNVIFGVPMEIAVGTGLCQMIGTAVSAFRRHSRLKQGEVKIDWILMAGALLGVQLGTMVIERLSTVGAVSLGGHPVAAIKFWLSLGYIAILGVVAAWMIHDARVRPAGIPMQPGPIARLPLPPYTWLPRSERRVSVLVLAYLGLFLGFLSGLMGLGGGVALMPILIYGIGMRVKMAAGTGILLLMVTSISGTYLHALLGNVHLGLAMLVMAGSTIGAPIGANLTHGTDGRVLRRWFGYLLLLTALAVVWNLLRVMI